MHIKVVTINTWKGEGAYYIRRQALARRLKQLDAQVIACQECFSTGDGRADTAIFLSETLGMHLSFLPCRPKKRVFEGASVDSWSGLAVLSSFPITGQKEFDLPAVPADEGRKAQQVEIAIRPGQRLLLTNTHLTHLPHATALRSAQVECLVNKASGRGVRRDGDSGQKAAYRLICGDFNAGPGSPEMELLRLQGPAADCYLLGKGKEPRRTLLHAASSRHSCVDHIFCLPLPGTNEYPAFIQSSVVLDTPDEKIGLFASDHFGIMTTLVME